MTKYLLPDRKELQEIRRALKDIPGARPEAETVAVQAFLNEGAWNLNNCDSYVLMLKAERPELWRSEDGLDDVIDAERAAGIAALEDSAFAAVPNLTSRGKLVRELGQDGADELARKHGLRDINDYTRKPEQKPARPDMSKNPWAGGEDEFSQARRVSVITGMGSKVAAEMAKAAGKRLDGRPLKVA